MAGRIEIATIDRIRDSADLVGLVEAEVALKRSGKSMKGLCPFHQEKTPSFFVFPDKGRYRCFGCGESGTAIDWVMTRSGVDFVEALEMLAERAGIVIERTESHSRDERGVKKSDLYRVNRWALRWFQLALSRPEGEACRRYLAQRGIDEDSQARFSIGYAPDSWDRLVLAAAKKGIPRDLLVEAGLASRRERGEGLVDYFHDRLMFPIIDSSDRVLGFGGRTLGDAEPKYINTRETRIFSKRRCLFGAEALRGIAFGTCIHVMEGYTDVVMARQQGLDHAVATLGTALTEDHARMLSRFTDRVRLVFDGDSAGRKAAERGAEIFAGAELNLEVCVLPKGKDPCDFLLEGGAAAVSALDESARDWLDYVLAEAAKRHDLSTVQGMARAADELLAMANEVRNPVKRGLVLDRVARSLGLAREDLGKRLETLKRPSRPRKAAAPAPPVPAETTPATVTPAQRRGERDVLELILRSEDLARRLMAELKPEDFLHAPHRALFGAMAELRGSGLEVTADRLDVAVTDPEQRAFLNRLVSRATEPRAEDGLGGPTSEEQASELLLWFKKQRLKGRLEAAKQAGDLDAVIRLKRELEAGVQKKAPVSSPASAPAREIPTRMSEGPSSPPPDDEDELEF